MSYLDWVSIHCGQHLTQHESYQHCTKMFHWHLYKRVTEAPSASWFDDVMINHESPKIMKTSKPNVIKNHHFEITKCHQKCFKNTVTFHDIWRSLVTFDYIWIFFMIKTHVLSWHVMTYHESSWHLTNYFREDVCSRPDCHITFFKS